jgi:hypothetical protein
MDWQNRKKALIIGLLLGLGALLAPGIGRFCQATQLTSMASRPCCEGRVHCGAQIKSHSCCCKAAPSSSRHSIPVPQVSLELAKVFPLLSFSYPTLNDERNFSQWIRATIAVFAKAPPFLAHHAFLC